MTRESDKLLSDVAEPLKNNTVLNLVDVTGFGVPGYGRFQSTLHRRELFLAQATPPTEVLSRVELNPEPPQASLDKKEERTKLESHVNAQLKGRDLRRVVDDLNTFERRAQLAGVNDQQVAEVYSNVSRILTADASAVLPEKERLRIAQQVIRNSAKPTSIDQGRHGTCNVAVVETRTYTRNPESAAKLVADVAITGGFTTADGYTITPTRRSLIPDDESGSNPPSDGQRSAASHVFQMTAANIHWQRRLVTPDAQISRWGKIVYEQIPSKRSRLTGDTGERVMDYNVDPPRETTDYKRGPSLGVHDLIAITNQITGKSEKDFVVENQVHGGPATKHVTSPKELEEVLKNGGNEMPIFIRVHTGNDPFLADNGGSFTRQRGVWHVVCVTGYDARTKKVSIDNQWGSRSDKNIDLEKLYKATMEPNTPEWKKKHEFFIVPQRDPFTPFDLLPRF